MKYWAVALAAFGLLSGCATQRSDIAMYNDLVKQTPDSLLVRESMAVAYSGFREGQHPDRGDGARNPSRAQILEDLRILVAHDFRLIRLYDAGENSRTTLELIRSEALPIKVLQGIWLEAEFSNHEGCAWLYEPIPENELASNTEANIREVARGIALAQEYDDIIVAVNVGNEALVSWTDHMVPLDAMIGYVRSVKAAITQQVSVAENYEWWISDGAPLARELDFVGVHTYPAWEGKRIDEAMAYTIENMARVQQALPGTTLAILEAGWATTASEFDGRASEASQEIYFNAMAAWATASNVTVFFFEAFDEPWKGNPDNADGAEKHWGLFFVDRSPKQRFRK
ncbi:MAG: glycosyl hydrolase [Pseudomonadota bacterium]